MSQIHPDHAVGTKVLVYGRHPGVKRLIKVEGTITRCFRINSRGGWIVNAKTEIGLVVTQLEDCQRVDAVSRLGRLAGGP